MKKKLLNSFAWRATLLVALLCTAFSSVVAQTQSQIRLTTKTLDPGASYTLTRSSGQRTYDLFLADNQTAIFTSSNTDVVTIDNETLTITAVAPGEATIHGEIADYYNPNNPDVLLWSGCEGDITVTVNKYTPQKNKAEIILDASKGESYTLTVGTTSDCDIQTDGSVTLEWNKPATATVEGLTITAVDAGSGNMKVTAPATDTYNALSTTISVKCKNYQTLPESITVDYNSDKSFSIASNTTFDTGATTIDDPNVATYHTDGKTLYLTAVNAGTTTLHVKTNETSKYFATEGDIIVTVNPPTRPDNNPGKEYTAIAELDFRSTEWEFPTTAPTTTTDPLVGETFTDGPYSVEVTSTNCYQNEQSGKYGNILHNYLYLGNGSTLTLPAFDNVDAIQVEVTTQTMQAQIFDGENMICSEKTGNPQTFTIPEDNQGTGKVYTLKVTGNRYEITKITLCKKDNTIQTTLNSDGYATLCSEYGLDFSDYETADYSAWKITAIEDDNITFEQVTTTVKGSTGLLLMGTGGATATIRTLSNVQTNIGQNLLVGTVVPTIIAADQYYGLSGKEFVQVNAGTVPAGKALLPASAVNGSVKSLNLIFTDETGIREIRTVSGEQAAEIFNLAGQRLQKTQKGVNIVNGKKVLVK